MANRPPNRDHFHIAIICALPLETNAVLCSLDEIWHDAPHIYGKCQGDNNTYLFGRSGRHDVVVVTLAGEGRVNAASSAQSLKMSFNSVKLALLVGICGAVPFKKDGTEILLGDVVISEVIVDLSHGRQYPGGFYRKDTLLDVYGRPDEEILGLLRTWKTPLLLDKIRHDTRNNLATLMNHEGLSATEYPGAWEDKLFHPQHVHMHHASCAACWGDIACENALTASCTSLGCDESLLIHRKRLLNLQHGKELDVPNPLIHLGSMGTGEAVMKSATERDEIADTENVIAFEMEGAGIWDKFGCLIIKGVCDYADSHKNKKWQNFAAAAAAATMKVVLEQYVVPQRHLQPGSSAIGPGVSPDIVVTTTQNLPILQDTRTLKALFEEKLSIFKRHFDQEQILSFTNTSAGSLKRLLKKIQDGQKERKAVQNLRRMERFLEAIENLGKVLEETLLMPGIICYVWGPSKLLLQIAKGHPDLLEAYLSAYDKIGGALPSFEDSHETFEIHLGLQRILAEILGNILEIHQKMTQIFCRRALKETFKSFWKDFQYLFDHIIHRLCSHKVLIEDEMRIPTSAFSDMSADSQRIRDHILQIAGSKFEFEKREIERHKNVENEVRDWFSYSRNLPENAVVGSEHEEYCNNRQRFPTIGDWILSHEKIMKWLSPDIQDLSHSILWLHGRPGTGKTYLASIMIEACRTDTSRETAYFYCSNKREGRATAIAVLRSILSQLTLHHRELDPYCHEKMKTSDSTILSSLKVAREILGVFCDIIPQLFVVIDAVDECESSEEAKNLLDTFKDLIQKCDNHSPGKLRVLFFSQPTSDIKNSLASVNAIALTPELNADDIRKYCQHRTRELEKFEFSEETIKNVVELIFTRADGMFLFARLVMDNLAGQPNLAMFRKEITETSLPIKIDQAYSRIMGRLERDLSPTQFDNTKLLLGWLVCSKRPLKWTEVQSASSVEIEVWNSSEEMNMDFKLVDDVQKLCGSLVQILPGDRVELVHSTTRRFIIEKSDINIASAECDLTLRCLRYLTLRMFQPRTTLTDEDLQFYALRGDLGLQDYAVSTWYMHVKSMVDTNLGRILENSASPEVNNQFMKIGHVLDHFVRFYETSFPGKDINEQTRQDCAAFWHFPFHDSLLKIWQHIRQEQSKDLVARNKVSIDRLKESLERNRGLLEVLSVSEGDMKQIKNVYGDCIFRCPKVLCFFFHEGFKTAQARENHVNRHERPFRCLIENCTTEGLGLASESALRRHFRTFHPDQCDLSESFTRLKRGPTTQARYECNKCHKTFVRQLILRDHLLAHDGEKPWACSECGKQFTRRNDRTRHEKTHERRRV